LTGFIGDLIKADIYNLKDKNAGNEEDEEQTTVFTDENKDAYWGKFIEMVTEREAELKDKAIQLFKEQEVTVLERIDTDVKYWRKDRRKGKESSVVPSVEEMSRIWESVWLSTIREVYIEQGD